MVIVISSGGTSSQPLSNFQLHYVNHTAGHWENPAVPSPDPATGILSSPIHLTLRPRSWRLAALVVVCPSPSALLYGFLRILQRRPINEAGERVTPSTLPTFRAEGFRRPCCLCAVPGLDGVGMGYKECSIYMCIGKQHFGKYMVGCASRKCGYRGMPCLMRSTLTDAPHPGVCIEQAYAMPGLPMQHFYRTEPGEAILSG
jgi:hypothetical protein